MKVSFIGECMLECALGGNNPIYGFGGDTMNTAIYLSRVSRQLGTNIDVQYFTAVGDDALSDGLIEQWSLEGIGVGAIYRDPSRLPGLYVINNDADGERSFYFWRGESAAKYMFYQPKVEEWLQKLQDSDYIFLSGVTLGILDEFSLSILEQSLIEAKFNGAKIIFDNNYRAALWPSALAAKAAFERIYCLSELSLISLEDEEAVFNSSGLESIVARFSEEYPQTVVVKNGGQGLWVLDSKGDIRSLSLDLVDDVVDTTAAGDSFNAAFLAGYIHGLGFDQALHSGHILAKEVIRHRGAIIPIHSMPKSYV